jgi:hypothetical protein
VRCFLQLQETHVEGRVVRHQHGVLREGVEGRQHLVDGRLAVDHVGRDAVDRDRRRGMLRCGSTSWSKLSPLQQLAVDQPRGADLDDLVAAGRVQAGGLGVEHGVGQLDQRALVQRVVLSLRANRSKS